MVTNSSVPDDPFFAARRLVMLTLVAVARAEPASGPDFSNTGLDAEAYGAAKGFPVPPVGQPATQEFTIGWHSHYDRLTPMRTVPKLDVP
jgi:hypothetical protein